MTQNTVSLVDTNFSSTDAATLSDDGQLLAYGKSGYDINTGYSTEIFLRNLQTNTTSSLVSSAVERITTLSFPHLSGDGKSLSFSGVPFSGEGNYMRQSVFVKDLSSQKISNLVDYNLPVTQSEDKIFYSAISSDGKTIAFNTEYSGVLSNDNNYNNDLFIYKEGSDKIQSVSLGQFGSNQDGNIRLYDISANGNLVLFSSSYTGDKFTTSAFNIYLKDLASGKLTTLDAGKTYPPATEYFPSAGNGGGNSYYASVKIGSMSADGRYVSYCYSAVNSSAIGLENEKGYYTVVADTLTGKTHIASTNAFGIPNNGYSSAGQLSSDGRYLTFISNATNLAPTSTASFGKYQVYVKDLIGGGVSLISANADGKGSNGDAYGEKISGNGKVVAFGSTATDLTALTDSNTYHLYSATIPAKMSTNGNDTIDSLGYGVAIQGGLGNDTYLISNTKTSIVEAANAGIELVKSTVSFSLPDNVENLTLIRESWLPERIVGKGNALDNTIIGAAFGSDISAGAGNDTIKTNGESDLIDGGSGNDSIDSGAGNDTVIGDSGNDTVFGGSGDDIIYAGLGNNLVDGGDGVDQIFATGKHDQYTVAKTAAGFSVFDKQTGTVDTVSNVEKLSFADAIHEFNVDLTLAQAYRIYQAAFNRTPDVGGLGFWFKQLQTGARLESVATGFTQSAEFIQLYGSNPENAGYVTNFYHNVLHREPDAGGLNYWLDLLDRHVISVPQVLVSFSESPENVAALVGVINNGVDYTPFG